MLADGSAPPQREKDVIKVLRQTGGGWKRKWCSLDESYVCENQVHDGTLHETGGVVNQREGAGKRLCMGGCGIYWTDENGDSHGKFLDFFVFSAVAAGDSKGKRGGPTVEQMKTDILRLNDNKWPAGEKARTTMKKSEMLKLYMTQTETVCDDTSAPLRASAEQEVGLESIEVEPHKAIDTFDYHGNFDAVRFELWFKKLCLLAFEECAGRAWSVEDENRYEAGLLKFDWEATSEDVDEFGEFIDMPGLDDIDFTDEEIAFVGGVLFKLDGAKYHRRCINPSPTKGWKRGDMIVWLEANHPDKISEQDKGDWRKGGLTKEKLFAIIKPLKPKKEFAMYDIARKYGHDVSYHVSRDTVIYPHPLRPSS